LPRLVEHDGGPGTDGGLDAWLRLGEAAGLARATLLDASGILPGVRFAVDAYINFCRFRPWQEAVAASLTELFAPDLMSRRIEAFERHYPWIAPEGLDYFRSRVTQGRKDATEGLALLLASPPSPEATERLVAAVEFKCDVLWSMLDAIAAASGDAGSSGVDQDG
jgi:pyrroloquinoline-quinone synthase